MNDNKASAAIVEPYAEALMSLAQSNQLTREFGENADFMLGLLDSSEDLKAALVNPFVKAEAKKAVLRELTQSQVQPYFYSFLLLLVDRRRIFVLEAICRQYRVLLRKLNNTVLAEVTSTLDLTEAQREAVIQKVKAMSNAAEVELETKINPDLIGGVVIRIGSQVLDASIRGQLKRVSLSLMGAT